MAHAQRTANAECVANPVVKRVFGVETAAEGVVI
jgi:hypothetical protein